MSKLFLCFNTHKINEATHRRLNEIQSFEPLTANIDLSNRPYTHSGTKPPQPIIFLPGWAFMGNILHLSRISGLIFYPKTYINPTTIFHEIHEFMAEAKIKKIEIIGWSMGAHLALDFAKQYPQTVTKITLISPRRAWSLNELESIRNYLRIELDEYLLNFYRKCFLGFREAFKEFTCQYLNLYLEKINLNLLEKGLDYLKNTITSPTPGLSVHLIYGSRDIITPASEMVNFPSAEIEIVGHAGHMPFLSPKCSLVKHSN